MFARADSRRGGTRDRGEYVTSKKAVRKDAVRYGPPIAVPQRRRLKTFRFDPMSSRQTGRSMDVSVSYEPDIEPGPAGKLVKVIDYDPVRDKWYAQLNLRDPFLADGGLAPDARDPRCHQQIVYAVAMSVIERFERHLGREFRWWSDSVLLLIPHAFEGANAYFDPGRNAVLFGYFDADMNDSGANLPGQTVYTCLSSDIIAHEVAHAVINRVRYHYQFSTNRDVFAFHEAIADLMALFQHFAYRDVVAEAIKSEGGGVQIDDFMFYLAEEFGESLGRGEALRSAVEEEPDPRAFRDATQPHERGTYFVAAVFDAYREHFKTASEPIVRLATGGSGVLPEGRLASDLISHLTTQALDSADRFLAMVVGAFNYLPPCDVTFGDVVRAIVTADWALNPEDAAGVRRILVEWLRKRGIVPARRGFPERGSLDLAVATRRPSASRRERSRRLDQKLDRLYEVRLRNDQGSQRRRRQNKEPDRPRANH